MPISCPQCEVSMPETAAFCPGCGRAMHAEPRGAGKVGILPETVAGGLSYVTFVPAAVFLLLEPYKKNRFVRFHSFQSIFLAVATLLAGLALRLAGLILITIPRLGYLLAGLITVVVILAALMIWVVLVVKALQGERFKLPVIGDVAERMAGSI